MHRPSPSAAPLRFSDFVTQEDLRYRGPRLERSLDIRAVQQALRAIALTRALASSFMLGYLGASGYVNWQEVV